MKKNKNIFVFIGLVIIILGIFYFSERKDVLNVEVEKNTVLGLNEYNEFKEILDKSIPLDKIETKNTNKSDGIEICRVLISEKECLFLKLDTTYLFNNKNLNFYFIKKPVENIFYKYQQVGDMDLVMQYSNNNFEFPKIAYLKNAVMNISKIDSEKYKIYQQAMSDGGVVASVYMIDSGIADFPYWVAIDSEMSIDSFNETKEIEEINFIKNIEIKKI